MGKKKNRAIKAIYAIDILLLIAVFILQYYSTKKMGVMRFLVYQNLKFKEGWLNSNLTGLYEYILIVLMILLSLYIFYEAIKDKGLSKGYTSIIALIFSSITYYVLIYPAFYKMKAYYFILLVLFVICIFQYILVGLDLIKRRRTTART